MNKINKINQYYFSVFIDLLFIIDIDCQESLDFESYNELSQIYQEQISYNNFS